MYEDLLLVHDTGKTNFLDFTTLLNYHKVYVQQLYMF
jgi:hypothetical protein